MASLKEEDEMVQEAALNELTELMSMSSEEALSVLPLEQLVPQLVGVWFLAECKGMRSHALYRVSKLLCCPFIHLLRSI